MAFVPVPIDDVVRDALATGQVRYSGGMLDIGPLRQMSDGFIAANYEPAVNITAWFDRLVLPGTFWQVTWDPEGLMSTFPAIVSGVIGMLIGKLILSIEGPHRKLTWMFFIGFSMYLAGGVWGWFMPLNKNLWSSSYTLWTAGVCTMGLAASILAVDILGYSRVTKLGRVYGANAITSYVLAGMLTLVFLFTHLRRRVAQWTLDGRRDRHWSTSKASVFGVRRRLHVRHIRPRLPAVPEADLHQGLTGARYPLRSCSS